MMSFMRLSVRRNVLLPQPDGPMNAVTTCGWMRMRDVLQRPLVAVEEVQRVDFDLAGGVGVGRVAAAATRGRRVMERTGAGPCSRCPLLLIAIAKPDRRRIHGQEQQHEHEDARSGVGVEVDLRT